MAWSPSATMYQDGSDRQAGTPITSLRVPAANACWTAYITLALTGSTSAAKWLTKSSFGSHAKPRLSMTRCANRVLKMGGGGRLLLRVGRRAGCRRRLLTVLAADRRCRLAGARHGLPGRDGQGAHVPGDLRAASPG